MCVVSYHFILRISFHSIGCDNLPVRVSLSRFVCSIYIRSSIFGLTFLQLRFAGTLPVGISVESVLRYVLPGASSVKQKCSETFG